MNVWKILFLFTFHRLKTLQTIEYNSRISGVLDEMENVLQDEKNAERVAKIYEDYLQADRNDQVNDILKGGSK